MTAEQPLALKLADALDKWAKDYAPTEHWDAMGVNAAAELRRLHDLLGKANALAHIRAERIEELEQAQRDEARVAELERFRAVVQAAMQIHVIDEDAIEWINQRLTFMRGEEGKQ